jgi:hypothetical protein
MPSLNQNAIPKCRSNPGIKSRRRDLPTCCGTPAGISSQMMATIPARCRHTLGIETFRTTTRYTALAPDRFKSFLRD